MIVAAISNIKERKGGKRIGIQRFDPQRKHTKVVVLKEDGEIVEEMEGRILGNMENHAPRNPRWIITYADDTWTNLHTLIDLKNLDGAADFGCPWHMALANKFARKPPRFMRGFEALRRFGGIWEAPQHVRQRILNFYAEKFGVPGGKPAANKAKISYDEKTLCLNVPLETRIYDLRSLEIEELITMEQLYLELLKRVPRKARKAYLGAGYVGLIDPEKPNIVWYYVGWGTLVPRVPVGIFVYDRESGEIIAGPKHPLEIIWEEGLDEEYPAANLVRREDLYNPDSRLYDDRALVGHIYGTYPGEAVFSVTVSLMRLAPRDRGERKRLGLPGGTRWSFPFKLDLDLRVRGYVSRFWFGDVEAVFAHSEWGSGGRYACLGCGVLAQVSMVFPYDPFNDRLLGGAVLLSRNFRVLRVFDAIRFEEWFRGEYGFVGRKSYYVGVSWKRAAVSPDGGRIFVPVVAEDLRSKEEWLYAFISDWSGGRVREVGCWERSRVDRSDIVPHWSTWV